jgi:hypothetical protein
MYARLQAMKAEDFAINLAPEMVAFLERHALKELLQFARSPGQFTVQTHGPIRDGFALAGLRMIEDRSEHISHPFHVEWSSIEAWLLDHLLQLPDGISADLGVAVIASFYAFCNSAPQNSLTRLLSQVRAFDPGWYALLVFALPRVPELLPAVSIASRYEEEMDFINGPFESGFVRDLPWERVVSAGIGSKLVLHNLQNNFQDLFADQVKLSSRYWNGARMLLAAGGGTLRHMDYPEFTITCRPGVRLVKLETLSQMVELSRAILFIHGLLDSHQQMQIVLELAEYYQDVYHETIDTGVLERVFQVLERHAIAYLTLKEKVLREQFEITPFRLRRKHIHRFWSDYTAGNLGELEVPSSFQTLASQYPIDALKEALAHALLDHFKDDWGSPETQAHKLKEILILLLRNVAVSYRANVPWLPEAFEDITEEDLTHADELAHFLIQQTRQAPLELAQALMIDPQQGLPLMYGGQVSPRERACRKIIREAAGV